MKPFELSAMKCNHCSTHVQGIDIEGWVVDPKNGPSVGAICPKCFASQGATAGWIILDALQASPERGAPILGSFKPAKSFEEILRFRSAGYFGEQWWSLEDELGGLFSSKHLLAELRIKTSQFPKLSFDFDFEGKFVTTIRCTGDRPKLAQLLSIHQKNRLNSMGLKETGSSDTDWFISIGAKETSVVNVARIITHILQFGYLFQIHKLASLTPMMDTTQNS
jgi:hypothetical protein